MKKDSFNKVKFVQNKNELYKLLRVALQFCECSRKQVGEKY